MNCRFPPFSKDQPLILPPVENGGWLVQSQDGDHCCVPRSIGAFSSSSDMLGALAEALIALPEDAQA